MKKIKRFFSELFKAEQDMDVSAIAEALNDPATRTRWLSDVLSRIGDLNMEVDRKLLSGTEMGFIDLCARRRAYKDILESILSARKTVTQDVRHNPKVEMPIANLDRVTV